MSSKQQREVTVADVLAKTLELFGPKGEQWIKGYEERWLSTGYAYCIFGGIDKASQILKAGNICNDTKKKVANALPRAYRKYAFLVDHVYDAENSIANFNDDPKRTFAQVKRKLCSVLKKELGIK